MLSVFGESARQHIRAFLAELSGFILERLPHWQRDREADLRSWLLWHLCYGLVAVGRDTSTDKVMSIVVVRLLNDPQEFETQYFHQPGGSICCAELAIADSPAALWTAIERLALIHGRPKQLLFQRGACNKNLRLYLWEKFGSKLKGQHVIAQGS